MFPPTMLLALLSGSRRGLFALSVFLLATATAPSSAQTTYESTTHRGQPAVVVTGGSNGIEHPDQGTDVTWSSDTVWILDGLVFVNE
ncbi:MAG TPA: hypothetical protein ACFCU0_07710, partial [Longibacter sp.]